MKLRELQQQFAKALANPADVDELQNTIAATKELPLRNRIDIYRNSLIGGFISALRISFPVCCKLVGEDFFTVMAKSYCSSQPSTSSNLTEYGANFSHFITGFKPAASLPYLADLARLEWVWEQAFIGPDATIIDIDALATVDEQEMQDLIFLLPQNASLLQSKYPIQKIWSACQGDTVSESVDINEGPVKLFIWRKGVDVFIETLTSAQWTILRACEQEQTVGAITNQIKALSKPVDMEYELPEMMRRGWFVNFIQRRVQ